MIIGIGTDIVVIERIEKNIARFGSAFCKNPHPCGTCPNASKNAKRQAEWTAARFACKEACVKALGTGFSEGIAPAHIQILRDEGKAPVLTLLAKAKEKADSLGVTRCFVSYSHEKNHTAVAFVVLTQQ